MAQLTISKLTKEYVKGIKVLNSISCTIEDGDFVVLLGASGCGKTTLLNIIAGVESLTQGDIYIDNKLCNSMSPQKRNIAVVFQDYALYPMMNVYNNIAFPLKNPKP